MCLTRVTFPRRFYLAPKMGDDEEVEGDAAASEDGDEEPVKMEEE